MMDTTFRALKMGGLLVLGANEHVAMVTPTDGWVDVPAPLAALIHRMVEAEEAEGVHSA